MRKLYRQNIGLSTDGENYVTIIQRYILYQEYEEPITYHFTDFDSLTDFVIKNKFGNLETSIFTNKIYGLKLFGKYKHIKSKQKNINIYYKISYVEPIHVTMNELQEELDIKGFIQYLKDNDITTINQKGLININRRK